jgi:hypothetical protein
MPKFITAATCLVTSYAVLAAAPAQAVGKNNVLDLSRNIELAAAPAPLCAPAANIYKQLTGPYGGPPNTPPVAGFDCQAQVAYVRSLSDCVANTSGVATGVFDQKGAILTCEQKLSGRSQSTAKAVPAMRGRSSGRNSWMCPSQATWSRVSFEAAQRVRGVENLLRANGCRLLGQDIPLSDPGQSFGFDKNEWTQFTTRVDGHTIYVWSPERQQVN